MYSCSSMPLYPATPAVTSISHSIARDEASDAADPDRWILPKAAGPIIHIPALFPLLRLPRTLRIFRVVFAYVAFRHVEPRARGQGPGFAGTMVVRAERGHRGNRDNWVDVFMVQLLILLGAALIVWVGAAIWVARQVAEASQTKIIRFATPDSAESMLDDAAIRIRLQGTGWQGEGGGETIQAFYPPHAGQHPLRIEASVDATGTARTHLVPEGTSRQMFWGVIPAGPTVPFGMEPFLRFVRAPVEQQASLPQTEVRQQPSSDGAANARMGGRRRSRQRPPEATLIRRGIQRWPPHPTSSWLPWVPSNDAASSNWTNERHSTCWSPW